MSKSVEYYISKGFDEKTAQYFSNGRRKITGVIPTNDFCLILRFDNGEKRKYDVSPLLKKNTVFETFMNISDFKRVYIDDTNCVAWDINPEIDSEVIWNNKVEICSDECYIGSKPIE